MKAVVERVEREIVAVPPLTREFNRELRAADFLAHKVAVAACSAHLADLKAQHRPLRRLQFREGTPVPMAAAE